MSVLPYWQKLQLLCQVFVRFASCQCGYVSWVVGLCQSICCFVPVYLTISKFRVCMGFQSHRGTLKSSSRRGWPFEYWNLWWLRDPPAPCNLSNSCNISFPCSSHGFQRWREIKAGQPLILSLDVSGNLRLCYWKWPIDSWFSHSKGLFSTVDGRNPAPSWMVETCWNPQNSGINPPFSTGDSDFATIHSMLLYQRVSHEHLYGTVPQ